MKEIGIIMSGDHPTKILDGTKTQTRRVITKHNSIIGEGGDWNNFDFYAQTFLNDRLKAIMADGAELGSIADISLKDKGRAPLPWADNSVSPKYGSPHTWQYLHVPYRWADEGTIYRVYPRWEVGDRLWVRETWQDYCPLWKGAWCGHGTKEGIIKEHQPVYKADPHELWLRNGNPPLKWHPSIHMPRWASRITLEITEVRVERLQEIMGEDCVREGVTLPYRVFGDGDSEYYEAIGESYIQHFRTLWDSLNAKRGYSWGTNPWVWVISFIKLKGFD